MYTLRPYQQEAVDAGLRFFHSKKKSGIIVAPTGCHAKDHQILMYDGSTKKVQDIIVGDLLMGVDSTPRTVLCLHSGVDEMYKITPTNNLKPFVVNSNHILYLEKIVSYKCDLLPYENISVSEYIRKGNDYKHRHKLRYSDGVEFGHKELELDPYFLGIYLGDGSSANGSISITTPDKEIIEYVYDFASKHGLSIRVSEKSVTDCCSYFLKNTVFTGVSEQTYIKKQLVDLGLYKKISHEKHIPRQYLFSSREQRLQLLAGLLDTDGSLDERKTAFEYSTKSRQLAEDIQFLCKSLGFFCNIGKLKIVKGIGYYRLMITGYLNLIPTKVERKHSYKTERQKNPMRHGFSYKNIGVGEYFGFTIDGDNLYLDSEFLIHHNCGKSLIISNIAKELDGHVLITQPTQEILRQNFDKLLSYDPFIDAQIFSASFNSKKIGKITYAMIGSIKNAKELFKHFDYIITDESHFVNAKNGMYKDFFKYLGNKQFLGLTATPYRLNIDGYGGAMLKFITRTSPKIYDEVLYYSQIKSLQDEGFLAKMNYYKIDGFDTRKLVVNSTKQDYTDESVKQYYLEIDFEDKIANVAMRLLNAGRKSVLIFTKFVDEAVHVQKRLGDICEWVSGETPKQDRDRILNNFKTGKTKVVANCGVLTTGFDFPELDTVLVGRATRSLALWAQICGRGMRPHPDKKECWVVDMCGTYDRFGKVEDLVLANDGGNQWYYHNGKQRLTNVYLQ